jgi:alpha-glucosidase
MTAEHLWWQTGIIYQVYPRSFQDSDGDGVGDLPGITSRLDYLQWLGVNAVWISPCFRSPMKDFGYDVSDYRDIDPLFGTLADMDRLIAEAHARGIRVILDFVPNHTSDQHEWFIESRSSRDNPKRDWYIWKDAKADGSPPNNWLSSFGGGAWEWDEHTGQYYYHAFLKEQPDLNWRNPEVRAAMNDVLRFWLDRGIDGFRVDVIYHLIKDEQWRDNPPNPNWKEGMFPYLQLHPTYSEDQDEVHEVIRELRATFDEYDERVMIPETYVPVPRLMKYYGEHNKGAHLPFNFQLLLERWDARRLAEVVQAYEDLLPEGAWPNWVLGNHDRPRIAGRVGRRQARVAAMLLLTLRGTPTVYYGEELAMDNVYIPAEKAVDPPAKIFGIGRDPVRTPMQWDATPNAGFTAAAEPWLPLAPDYAEYNVAAERDDPTSMLALYRRLIELRQSEDALMIGGYAGLPAEGPVLAYTRRHGDEAFAVLLNFSREPQTVELDAQHAGRIVLSTHLEREGEAASGPVELRADEGVIVRVG